MITNVINRSEIETDEIETMNSKQNKNKVKVKNVNHSMMMTIVWFVLELRFRTLTFVHDIVLMHALIDLQLLDHELINNDVMKRRFVMMMMMMTEKVFLLLLLLEMRT